MVDTVNTTPARARPSDTLRIIELLLRWEGAVRNERLTKVLGIHFTTASRLLAEYQRLHEKTVAYDQAGKRYVAHAGFRPTLTTGDVEEYLALLKRFDVDPLLSIERAHTSLGAVSPATFSFLQRAASEGWAVRVRHRSMRNPAPVSKVIYPHALVEAGRRWHVRAYVADAAAFQDLALTRLSDLEQERTPRPEAAEPAHDRAWQTIVPVRLVAHPALSAAQEQLVRDEYFPRASARVLKVRGALLPYVLHDLRAATNVEKQRPPDFQLAVSGVESLGQWLLPP